MASTSHANDDSPINRFPNEILIAIFTYSSFTPSPPVFAFEDLIPPLEDALCADAATMCAIISVCTLWRSIALSTPSLWTSVTWTKEDVKKRSKAGFQSRFYFFAASLERSASRCIDLCIAISADQDDVCTRLRDACNRHLDRVRSIRYSAYHGGDVIPFFPLRGKMSALRLLQVQCEGTRNHAFRLFEANNEAPLEVLSLHGRGLTSPSSLHDVRTGNLSSLAVSGHTERERPLNTLLEFIASCRNLQSLWFSVIYLSRDERLAMELHLSSSRPPFDCADLRSCHLLGQALYLFPKFAHAAQLRSLTLSRPGRNEGWFWTPAAPIPSADHIHCLTLNGDDTAYPTVSYLVSTLQRNGHIMELRLKKWLRAHIFLRQLTEKGSGPGEASSAAVDLIAPSLETLVLDACMLEGQVYRAEFVKGVKLLLAREVLTIWLDQHALDACVEHSPELGETGMIERLRLLPPS